ncbi:MAG: hypothetical protein JXQ73_26560 [Phycisphaerae bacterium]|nr:hypothetical protein [Phycisphaerae bacterium]
MLAPREGDTAEENARDAAGRRWLGHGVAVVLCVAFASSLWLRNSLTRIAGDQSNIVTMITAQDAPENFARDPFFSGTASAFYPPFFCSIMRWLIAHFGILGAHRVAQFPLTVIYLLVMYGALYAITRSTPAAVVVAMLSAQRLMSLGGSYWGVDTVGTVQPRTFVLIFTPALFFLAWRLRESWWFVLPFALTGLLLNVNPPGALFFGGLLGAAFLLTHRTSNVRSSRLAAAAVAFVIGAAPFAYTHVTARASSKVEGPAVPREDFMAALEYRFAGTSSFPIETENAHQFLSNFGPMLFLAAAGWVLRNGKRGPLDRWLLCFFLLAAIAPVVAQYVMQKTFMAMGKAPPIANVMRAQKNAYLVMYVYAAFLILELMARTNRRGRVLLVVTAGAAAIFGGPLLRAEVFRANLSQLRELASGNRLHVEAPDIDRVADWARDETPRDALFLFSHTRFAPFRFCAQRSLVTSFTDGGMALYNGPARIVQWHRWQSRLREAVEDRSVEKLLKLANEARADYIGISADWPGPPDAKLVYSGHHWDVYERPKAGSFASPIPFESVRFDKPATSYRSNWVGRSQQVRIKPEGERGLRCEIVGGPDASQHHYGGVRFPTPPFGALRLDMTFMFPENIEAVWLDGHDDAGDRVLRWKWRPTIRDRAQMTKRAFYTVRGGQSGRYFVAEHADATRPATSVNLFLQLHRPDRRAGFVLHGADVAPPRLTSGPSEAK